MEQITIAQYSKVSQFDERGCRYGPWPTRYIALRIGLNPLLLDLAVGLRIRPGVCVRSLHNLMLACPLELDLPVSKQFPRMPVGDAQILRQRRDREPAWGNGCGEVDDDLGCGDLGHGHALIRQAFLITTRNQKLRMWKTECLWIWTLLPLGNVGYASDPAQAA
jgi:hypothetical protein